MHAEVVQATVRAANYLSSYELVEDLRGRREDTPTGTFTAWALPSCDVWDGGTACDQKLGCVEEVWGTNPGLFRHALAYHLCID